MTSFSCVDEAGEISELLGIFYVGKKIMYGVFVLAELSILSTYLEVRRLVEGLSCCRCGVLKLVLCGTWEREKMPRL